MYEKSFLKEPNKTNKEVLMEVAAVVYYKPSISAYLACAVPVVGMIVQYSLIKDIVDDIEAQPQKPGPVSLYESNQNVYILGVVRNILTVAALIAVVAKVPDIFPAFQLLIPVLGLMILIQSIFHLVGAQNELKAARKGSPAADAQEDVSVQQANAQRDEGLQPLETQEDLPPTVEEVVEA
jgi:hypothetical protein